MEEWELYRRDYESMSKAIKPLLKKGLYGLAAFQAQQSLEVLIKACICKYGFEKYLQTRLRDGDETFYAIFEFDKNIRSSLVSHLPSGAILRLTFDFIELQIRKIGNQNNIDTSLRPVLEEMRFTISTLVNLLKYVDSKGDGIHDPRLELWKVSLKLETPDKQIRNNLDTILEAGRKNLVDNFALIATDYTQRKVRDLIASLRQARNFNALHFQARDAIHEIFEKIGIPDYLAVVFLDDSPQNFRDALIAYLQSEDDNWRMLTALLAPGGVTDFVADKQIEFRSVNVAGKRARLSRVRYDFTWVPYLMSISYVAVFLYPHEQIGRYIRVVENETTTYELYSDRSKILRELIERAQEACIMLTEIIDTS
jgi:hypothetical protein